MHAELARPLSGHPKSVCERLLRSDSGLPHSGLSYKTTREPLPAKSGARP